MKNKLPNLFFKTKLITFKNYIKKLDFKLFENKINLF